MNNNLPLARWVAGHEKIMEIKFFTAEELVKKKMKKKAYNVH
jgi:hypothetical protein